MFEQPPTRGRTAFRLRRISMIAMRVFLYVTVPLLIFGIFKEERLFSASFFELLMYVFLLGTYLGVLIAYLKKELHQLSSK